MNCMIFSQMYVSKLIHRDMVSSPYSITKYPMIWLRIFCDNRNSKPPWGVSNHVQSASLQKEMAPL